MQCDVGVSFDVVGCVDDSAAMGRNSMKSKCPESKPKQMVVRCSLEHGNDQTKRSEGTLLVAHG